MKNQQQTKKGKGRLMAIIIFIFLGILGAYGESDEEATKQETTTEVKSTAQKTEKKKEKQASKEKNEKQKEQEKKKSENEKKRKEVQEIDEQLHDIAMKTGASYGKLVNAIQKFSDDGANADILEFYNLAKSVKDDCFFYFREANDISYKGAETYKESLISYILTCQSISENLMKYIDKSEMKYISKAQEQMQYIDTIVVEVSGNRFQFLTDNGFTIEEISELTK